MILQLEAFQVVSNHKQTLKRNKTWTTESITNEKASSLFYKIERITLLYHMKQESLTRKQGMRIHTTRTRQIDKRGDERDFECKAPTKGKLPLSPTRLVEPTCLLDMTQSFYTIINI